MNNKLFIVSFTGCLRDNPPDVSYGSMMLSDYGIDADSFWFYGDELSIFPQLFLRDKQDMAKLDKATIEVRIKDDFGNEYSAVTK